MQLALFARHLGQSFEKNTPPAFSPFIDPITYCELLMELGHKDIASSEAQRAASAWVISGVYQFTSPPELSLASWEALLFFTIGTCLAAVGFGWLEQRVTRAAAKLIARHPLSRHRSVEAQRARRVGALIALFTFAATIACASQVARSIL